MLLILSARIVGEDIAMHYGRLPPSFLPLGNQRLFAMQAERAAGEGCAMTVPDHFEIQEIDRQALAADGIEILPQPPGLSLTGALAHALDALAPAMQPGEPLRLLYGDTLVRMPEITPAADLVAVQETTANYQWAYVSQDADGGLFSDAAPEKLETRRVVCGYYVFSDPALLARACASGSIVEALNIYHEARPLTLVETEDWFDFGHLPLYFQSKKSIMIKRVFNDIRYENHVLIKQSEDTAKIRAEANWYEHLPADLQIHVPRYRGRVERNFRAGYAIEYLYHPLLSDLDAFGTLPLSSWLEILSACFEFIDKCQAIGPDPGAPEASVSFASDFFEQVVVEKTWTRLKTYTDAAGISLSDRFRLNGRDLPPLETVIGRLIAAVPPTGPEHIRFWHGDLFLGNMFYDFTARRILAIDPRGQIDRSGPCLYGDWRYDLAKLAHSIIGQYDKIILGRSTLDEIGPRDWVLSHAGQDHQAHIEEIFLSQVTGRYGISSSELLALTALLFFSMLPLHGDRPDLQRQMLANGLRLACLIEGVCA